MKDDGLKRRKGLVAGSQEGRLLLQCGHGLRRRQREQRQENNFLGYHKRMWKGLGNELATNEGDGTWSLVLSNIETPSQLGKRWYGEKCGGMGNQYADTL